MRNVGLCPTTSTGIQRLHHELESVVILTIVKAASRTTNVSEKQSRSLCAHGRLCIQLFGMTAIKQPANKMN